MAIVEASEDLPQRRLSEQHGADATETLRLALEAGGLGTFRWHMATGVTEWDAKLEGLFGLEPGSFGGTFEEWVARLHPDDADEVLRTLDHAVKSKGHYTVEHRVVWPDGSVRWLHGAGHVTLDEAGNVTGTLGCSRDVTDQKETEFERQRLTLESIEAADQERVSRERLEFLASINDALSVARDRHEIMVNVTRAAVPRLGDWCAIYVLPHLQARVPDIEIAHADPEMVAYARALQDQFPYDPDAAVGMPRVLRTRTAEFYPLIDEGVLDDLNLSDDARDVARSLALRSSIAVPLTKKGRLLGGLQFVMSSSSRRRYTQDDLTLALAAAARIAASLDNLRLSEEQRSIASTLQASLLPSEVIDIPGVEIAVRYWANGESVDVGGDFYDFFRVTAETWAVVIGDVCGTGPSAAAVTGLVRHSVASAAWHGDDHRTVLDSLNRAMLERGAGPFCTALYGTVRPSAAGVDFTFASGGHPLPIIAKADGSATTCGTPGTLIGAFDQINVTTTTLVLHPDDTVVLYTDGATDVRPPYGLTHEEFTRLVGRANLVSTSAEHLADLIHAELSSILGIDQRHDDIALLILRSARTER